MRWRGGRGVVFRVANACAGGHMLQFARHDHSAGADRVFVGDSAVEDVSHDFHFTMAVGAEAAAALDHVFIDDP